MKKINLFQAARFLSRLHFSDFKSKKVFDILNAEKFVRYLYNFPLLKRRKLQGHYCPVNILILRPNHLIYNKVSVCFFISVRLNIK